MFSSASKPKKVRRVFFLKRSVLLPVFFATAGLGQSLNVYEQQIPGTDVSFRMMPVPAGTFLIGSPAGQPFRDADEGPQKSVSVSAFWMGEKEVTFAEWDLFFLDHNLPQGKAIDGISRPTPQYIDLTWGMGREQDHPVNSMSQQGAIAYCKWLYDKTGVFYRLPTEAEWEYACRLGFQEPPDPMSLRSFAYFALNSDGKYHKTAGLEPNNLGIYDQLGNLAEWTLDQYVANGYETIAAKDPVVTPTRRYPRVVRGGSYKDEASMLRCANRQASQAEWNRRDPQFPKSEWWLTDGMFVGFRLVRPYKQPSSEEIDRFFEQYSK